MYKKSIQQCGQRYPSPWQKKQFLFTQENFHASKSFWKIYTLIARTNQYFNSFFLSSIRDWNSLSEEHRNSMSVGSFKHTLSQQIYLCLSTYFFVGDRRPQVLHSRLHTKCSALNYEIYLKNFTVAVVTLKLQNAFFYNVDITTDKD